MEDLGVVSEPPYCYVLGPIAPRGGHLAKRLIPREVPVSLQLFETFGSCCLRSFQLQWCTERRANYNHKTNTAQQIILEFSYRVQAIQASVHRHPASSWEDPNCWHRRRYLLGNEVR